jgi:hypothetical protein
MALRARHRLQHDIAGALGNGSWGYVAGTYAKDAGPNNQRLYLYGARVAQMSIDLNSAALGIGQHVPGLADPFNGHIDEFRIAHDQFRECGYRQHQGCWSSVGQKRFQSPSPRSVAKVNSKSVFGGWGLSLDPTVEARASTGHPGCGVSLVSLRSSGPDGRRQKVVVCSSKGPQVRLLV